MTSKPVVIVTGASRGLGRVIYEQLKHSQLYEVAGTTRGTHKELITMDLGKKTTIDGMLTQVMAEYGRVDILINNAGSNYIGSVEATNMSEYEHVAKDLLLGTIYLTKQVLETMQIHSKGQIITIASLGSKMTLPYNSSYSVYKHGLDGFMNSLWLELKGGPVQATQMILPGLKIVEQPIIGSPKQEVHRHLDSIAMKAMFEKGMKPAGSREAVVIKLKKILKKKALKPYYTTHYFVRLALLGQRVLPTPIFLTMVDRQIRKQMKD